MDDEQERLARLFHRLRSKLLDESLRNPLVSYKHRPSSKRQLRFVDVVPEETYRRLVVDNAAVQLLPLPEPDDVPADERSADFVSRLEYAKTSDPAYLAKAQELEGRGLDGDLRHECIEGRWPAQGLESLVGVFWFRSRGIEVKGGFDAERGVKEAEHQEQCGKADFLFGEVCLIGDFELAAPERELRDLLRASNGLPPRTAIAINTADGPSGYVNCGFLIARLLPISLTLELAMGVAAGVRQIYNLTTT